MIGLVASLLAGVVLGKWVFALATFPYVLRLRSRNLSLIAFYLYVLILIFYVSGGSIYTHSGLVTAVSSAASVFLLLDDVLRGVRIGRRELVTAAVLLASAVYDYTFIITLIGVVLYVSYVHFGRGAYYLAGWMASSVVVLYLLRNSLVTPVMQSFVLIGLGLIFLLLAERRDVKFLEVDLFEEE
ncbi:hypothetical protein [Thermococcus sp.]|uniref:hypothetical protein n=1 Tax=Thermococcus sp. TaxID=35749 RepID=UPI00262F8087|nr:hypothetical protein [Thermococcus sp.]